MYSYIVFAQHVFTAAREGRVYNGILPPAGAQGGDKWHPDNSDSTFVFDQVAGEWDFDGIRTKVNADSSNVWDEIATGLPAISVAQDLIRPGNIYVGSSTQNISGPTAVFGDNSGSSQIVIDDNGSSGDVTIGGGDRGVGLWIDGGVNAKIKLNQNDNGSLSLYGDGNQSTGIRIRPRNYPGAAGEIQLFGLTGYSEDTAPGDIVLTPSGQSADAARVLGVNGGNIILNGGLRNISVAGSRSGVVNVGRDQTDTRLVYNYSGIDHSARNFLAKDDGDTVVVSNPHIVPPVIRTSDTLTIIEDESGTSFVFNDADNGLPTQFDLPSAPLTVQNFISKC